MEKKVKVYYDKEADFLEVIFKKEEGYFIETENDQVMEKINNQNEVIGFSILNASKISSNKILEISLEGKGLK